MGLTHFWTQGDAITHAVALLLAVLSLLSWATIGTRFFAQLKINSGMEEAFNGFWEVPSLDIALQNIKTRDRSGIFAGMAATALHVAHRQAERSSHDAASGLGETLTRALRNYMVQAQARSESGLTFLASVGSTAPFIGLFGTVWGIYHALVGLAGATQVVLDKVAGPVGEALIMTAAGLFVAIPAVLAYNALNRANRLVSACLDGFAHDLHASLTTGSRLSLARAA
jgi:biopolymer transport protein ExbB